MAAETEQFEANGRSYRPPRSVVAVICMDGCGDEYLDAALARERMPRVAEICRGGYRGLVRGALPSFTNVNNAAIVAGAAPSVTGISGNYFLDPQTGAEVMMNSASYLRCETIMAAAARAGRQVACVTAKDKLRDLLSAGLPADGIGLSAEKAAETRLPEHGVDEVCRLVGMPAPPIYGADASLWVLRAGAALAEAGLADFLYLSLTDYMQHRYPPESEPVLEFYQAVDVEIGRLLEAGAVVAATADHGMNAKTDADGLPNVIFLESVLKEQGVGATVICPITDPYVAHHGALGSMVTVHLADPQQAESVGRQVLQLSGVTEVHTRETAAAKLELPADRIGDLVVLAGRNWVLGRTPDHHDLSALHGALRSHGGRYEEMVPMLLSRPLSPAYAAAAAGDPRNFDIFDFACNGAARR